MKSAGTVGSQVTKVIQVILLYFKPFQQDSERGRHLSHIKDVIPGDRFYNSTPKEMGG